MSVTTAILRTPQSTLVIDLCHGYYASHPYGYASPDAIVLTAMLRTTMCDRVIIDVARLTTQGILEALSDAREQVSVKNLPSRKALNTIVIDVLNRGTWPQFWRAHPVTPGLTAPKCLALTWRDATAVTQVTTKAILEASVFVYVDLIDLLHSLVTAINRDTPWLGYDYDFDFLGRPNAELTRRTVLTLAYYNVGGYKRYQHRHVNGPTLPKRLRLNRGVSNRLKEALYVRLKSLNSASD